jgi:hypothetical protein
MRFLVIDAEYPEFIEWLYSQNPSLKGCSYEKQMHFRNDRLYGMADYYSSNLKKLGHEAQDVWINNEFMQRSWAKENDFDAPRSWRWHFRLRRRIVPWITRVPDESWMFKTLAAQIERYKPDVLVNMMMGYIPARFLREIEKHTRLIVGWGSPPVRSYRIDPAEYRGLKHVVVTPSKTMLEYWRGMGLDAELLRHAFEPRVLSKVSMPARKSIPISFVGLLRGENYRTRRKWLEFLCAEFRDHIHVWASSLEDVGPDSPIRQCYQGEAWGKDLYEVLSRSTMIWNSHHELAGHSADNLRLFEATGLGALLITDWKDDLRTMFEIGKEVVAYRTINECAQLIRRFLDCPAEGEEIARAGQRRTLQDHTYWVRAQQLAEIARRHLSS